MIKPFIAATVVMLILDAIWLTLNYTAHSKLIETVQKSAVEVRLIPALLVYILIPAAVYYFAIEPSKTQAQAALKGSLLGLSMYGLYDLTNLSTLKGWTVTMAIKDSLWGTVLCGIGSVAGFYFK